VDRRFRRALPEHEVFTVQEMGWSGMKNGELLHSAQAAFQVFITVDRNLYFQQTCERPAWLFSSYVPNQTGWLI
jgi:hypothetical protein